jgi:hypothetical protein
MLPSAAKAEPVWSIYVRAEARTLQDLSLGEFFRRSFQRRTQTLVALQEIRAARRFRPTYAGGERGAPVQGTRLAVGRPKPLASSQNYPHSNLAR